MSQTVQTTPYTAGMTIRFNGYQAEAGAFAAGIEVTIEEVRPDEGLVVADPATGTVEVVWPEEVSLIEGATAETAAPAAKTKGKGTGKGKTKETARATQEAAPKVTKAAAKAKTREAPASAETAAPAVKTKGKGKAKAEAVTTKEVYSTEAQDRAQAAGAEEGAVVSITDSDTVLALLAEQDVLDAAKALVARSEETYFTLGGVLNHIYVEGTHKSAGYQGKRGFEDYVAAELGIAYRKAMYLINIYRTFRAIGVDEKRLTAIGWSKAKELTNYATPDNVEELLVKAGESKNRDELVDYLKTTYTSAEDGGETGERMKKTRFSFAAHADQAGTIERAIEAAKEKANSENLAHLFEMICADWLMLNAGVEVSLDDEIARLQTRFGVTLVVQGACETQAAA